MNRAERERKAYDETGVVTAYHAWYRRTRHVFECPNSVRVENTYHELIRNGAVGKDALELGCAEGTDCERLLSAGARRVRGIDVSEHFIAQARLKTITGRLEFTCADVLSPFDGTYDVIFGKAILHHVDYRTLLVRLYRSNLSPGGMMVFLEPLGENLFLKLYRLVARAAHTPDEAPFHRRDLGWLRREFPDMDVIPRNYLSLPAGVISTWIFSSADNALMRLTDRADVWLAEHAKGLIPSFRQAVFVIRKPL